VDPGFRKRSCSRSVRECGVVTHLRERAAAGLVEFRTSLRRLHGRFGGLDPVAIRAREIKPGIKVLLTSGYAEELVRGDDLQRENLKVLRKPYQQADLVAALRDVLGNGST